MLFLAACSSTILGGFNGNTYTNKDVGISFIKPDDWSITSTEKLYTDITAMNTAIGQTVDSNIQRSLGNLQILRFFVISKGSDESDTLEKYYPQFTCIAEKRAIGSDESKEVILKKYMIDMLALDNYVMQGEASIVAVNGSNYYAATSVKTTSDATFYRTIYTIYKDERIITFDYTALDEQKEYLNTILETLTLK